MTYILKVCLRRSCIVFVLISTKVYFTKVRCENGQDAVYCSKAGAVEREHVEAVDFSGDSSCHFFFIFIVQIVTDGPLPPTHTPHPIAPSQPLFVLSPRLLTGCHCPRLPPLSLALPHMPPPHVHPSQDSFRDPCLLPFNFHDTSGPSFL